MTKIKEVIINELQTGKNYAILENGRKFDIGRCDDEAFIKFFGTYAGEIQANFPNVQHNIKGLHMGANSYPSHILGGAVVMDAAPLFNEVKAVQIGADVQVDDDLGTATITYNGMVEVIEF